MPAAGPIKRIDPSPGIQFDQDLRFQERIWRIERVGWLAMAAILFAAVLGLFGRGLLSQASVEVADPDQAAGRATMEYERFGRAHSESQFVLFRSARTPKGTFSLWLSSNYLKHAELVRVTPEPIIQELTSSGVRYRFRVEDGPQTVILRFRPERPGRLWGAIRLNDGPPTTFDQWVFP